MLPALLLGAAALRQAVQIERDGAVKLSKVVSGEERVAERAHVARVEGEPVLEAERPVHVARLEPSEPVLEAAVLPWPAWAVMLLGLPLLVAGVAAHQADAVRKDYGSADGDEDAASSPTPSAQWWLPFFLGMGSLLSWNLVLHELEFFDQLDAFENQGWPFKAPMCFQMTSVAMLLVTVQLGPYVSMTTMYCVGSCAIVAGLAWLYVVRLTVGWNLLGTVLLGVGTALTQCAATAVGARLGPSALSAVFAGQGFVGVLIGFVGVTVPRSELTVMLIFLLGAVVQVVLAVTYWQRQASFPEPPPIGPEPRSASAVLRDIWPFALAVHVNFFATLAVFPGVISQWHWPHGDLQPERAAPKLADYAVAEFQILDFVGRLLAGKTGRSPAAAVPVSVAARLAFVPLFCALRAAGTWPGLHFAAMAAMATTNGFFATQSMLGVQALVSSRDQDRAGFLATVCLVSGLFLGTLFALGLA